MSAILETYESFLSISMQIGLKTYSIGRVVLQEPVLEIPERQAVTEYAMSIENTYDWLFTLLALFTCIGAYLIFKFFARRIKIQRSVLQRKVEMRTSEISKQKEELQKQSEELKNAYEEIQMKNMAIEEAFEHLSNSYAKLSDLNREKDGMMSIVAHDLRTPLNNIEGLIHLLTLDGNLNDDQKEYITTIRAVVKRGNEMIRDLLDINQAKKVKPELKITEFSIDQFIKSWKINFDKPLSNKEQKLHISGNYESILVKTDMGILSRIMDNLMSNAMKFSEKGKNIYLDINPINDNLQIILRDEGPGISEADQLKMFKPFVRLSARPTDGEHSNGLGLSIIKSLSQQLGGNVEVQSTLGEGTAFQILIPVLINTPAEKVLD
ncbi:HAMP domain-containing histidine kinase [Reichenbachiella agarivorans]|uniref:histidine kinase n=1 Tax=Reichenbachiella agarivorans TaxID=2979464 RepID=A0ABY6CR62_9BACT|nr:HAMP domain-containing sensor histidine kinase [Reichenbachiella agarivorans]UXP32986.1 HAMP domain-containing histidine kinase [Reichenbachiella agarivorans]